jgi:UDP-glucose 6-dehydrogenase
MRIAIIGTGYVGLVSGACFSDFGHDVICVDKDKSKIDALERNVMPIFEPGLDDLVARNVRQGRLSFTTDLAKASRARMPFSSPSARLRGAEMGMPTSPTSTGPPVRSPGR